VVLQEINEKLDKSDYAPVSHTPKEKKWVNLSLSKW
jgi:hypothetical protein